MFEFLHYFWSPYVKICFYKIVYITITIEIITLKINFKFAVGELNFHTDEFPGFVRQ